MKFDEPDFPRVAMWDGVECKKRKKKKRKWKWKLKNKIINNAKKAKYAFFRGMRPENRDLCTEKKMQKKTSQWEFNAYTIHGYIYIFTRLEASLSSLKFPA